MRAIEAKKAEISVVDGTIQTRRMEVGRIEKDQARLRENMKALKGSAEEKQLVLRYTRQLDAHEDQLEAINEELETLDARRDTMQEELEKMLETLSFDVVVAAQQ